MVGVRAAPQQGLIGMLILQACSGELMSHNTYKNIVKNKGNVDYCIEVHSTLLDMQAHTCMQFPFHKLPYSFYVLHRVLARSLLYDLVFLFPRQARFVYGSRLLMLSNELYCARSVKASVLGWGDCL